MQVSGDMALRDLPPRPWPLVAPPRRRCARSRRRTRRGTGRRKQFADCCATSKPFTFVFCDFCESDLELARCSTCYAKFASKLKRRLPEIASSMGAQPHLEPVVQALLETDWAAVGRGDRRAANDLIYFDEESGTWRAGAMPARAAMTSGSPS